MPSPPENKRPDTSSSSNWTFQRSRTPTTGWPVNTANFYYVQGVHDWQAEYVVKSEDTVTAKWGDNLSGSAKLKVGQPVRVEMVLTSTTETAMQGYTVVKLEPDKLDRLAAYGTLATSDGAGGYSATASTMAARVWGPEADVTITGPGDTTLIGDMPGEINSVGGVVFGYNWRPAATGEYTLTFNPPAGVTISGSASITVTVGGGGGGGGRPVR